MQVTEPVRQKDSRNQEQSQAQKQKRKLTEKRIPRNNNAPKIPR